MKEEDEEDERRKKGKEGKTATIRARRDRGGQEREMGRERERR